MSKRIADPTRYGAHRSLEILKELADVRISAVATQRASRAVSDINWQPAQSYAIQRDDFRTVWHAGHVTALLTNGVDVIAAAQTGGVWLLNEVLEPTPLSGYTGTPLSDGWDSPDVSCLAWAPEGKQAFVGTASQAIFLLEFETVLGAHLTFKQSTALPVPFSTPAVIVTLTNPHRIVVANGFGVWWSPIPQPASTVEGYEWKGAQGLPTANYTGLAVGPDASVAAAKDGGSLVGIGLPQPGGGIYRGTFQGGELVFAASNIAGVDPSQMRRTSLASCEDQPDRMYAVAAAPDDTILAVLSSSDGGATWSVATTPDKNAAGDQGFYNNCIAVSPQRPDLVVVGWLSGGPFWSEDGTRSWRQPLNQQSDPNLHNDLHAVCLGRNPDGPEPLYVGGDGGIVVSQDLGNTYHSQFNRPLHNLQFYGGSRSSLRSTAAGSLTASSRYPGLLAGGLQDNGNVYRCPDISRGAGIPRQADTPWLRHVAGDGDLNRFVDPLGVLLNFDNTNINLGMTVWDDSNQRFPPGPGQVIAADDSPGGVAPTSVEVVQTPAFRKNSQLMFAAVGSTDQGVIHGLFAADPSADHPDARNVTLVRLGLVGDRVTAIASTDGSTMMIGTATRRIVSFDSASGSVTEYTVPDQAIGAVTRIEIFPSPFRPGLLPDNAFALVGGRILYFNGLDWAITTGTDWVTFARDSQSGRLFGATDADVFVSEDNGPTWVDASAGLPVRSHCSDLRVADDGMGGRDLYLATYGHSVWRAQIDYVQQGPNLKGMGEQIAQILAGILGDAPGIELVGGHIRHVQPHDPLIDMLTALAIDRVAQTMSTDASRAIRRAALATVKNLAEKQLQAVG